MNFDLHTHSTASDGTLTPTELVELAVENKITHLALTDHDTLSGLDEAAQSAKKNGIHLIPGVELSVTWQKKLFHIVGLNIDPTATPLKNGVNALQAKRIERAKRMGESLNKKGITGIYERAKELAGNGMITRTHFARALVENGFANDVPSVFKSYLKPGKPGYVRTEWATLEESVDWIKSAGGVAVLAHPGRYKLSASWLRRFLADFKETGGEAIEIVYGHCNPVDIQNASQQAKRFDLLASTGSDFHSQDSPWNKLGSLAPLPKNIKPVWELF